MSLTSEERKALAIECGFHIINSGNMATCSLNSLAKYTAAVEANSSKEVAELTRKLTTMTRIAEYDHKSCLLYDPGYPQFNDPAGGDYLSALLAKERERCEIIANSYGHTETEMAIRSMK